MRPLTVVLRVLALVAVLLLFFVSLELMGDSFKLMGKGFARTLLETTSNPFVGLFIGILATSLIQSSSTTTAMTVSMVAGGALSISGAIPIIMGANIGTSVTNTIVSLGSVTRKNEFRLAMAGATVHDFFNLLAVAVLFPLELLFHPISYTAAFLTDALTGLGGLQLFDPLSVILDPVVEVIVGITDENGLLVLIFGLAGLFLALRYLTVLLKSLVLGPAEKLIHKYLFGQPAMSMAFGALITLMVQSSSITTSLTVPLVGAGILTVRQIYPFVLGANIGTTGTAILAALVLASTGTEAGILALNVAFAHLAFNVFGISLFFPIKRLREIPIRASHKLGELAIRNRGYALGYVATIFFAIPVVVIFATRNMEFNYDIPQPDVLEETEHVPADTTGNGTTGALLRGVPQDAERLRLVSEPAQAL